MSTAKKLALIAVGYVVAIVIGCAAVAINELRMPADIAQGSPGMVAFGDMILFVLVAGFFSLAPSWFLLKLLVAKAPRTLLGLEFLAAVLGPVSWLAVIDMAGGPNRPAAMSAVLGPFIALIAIPRIVFGPIMVVIEAVTFLLFRERVVRVLLVVAMLMDIVPLGLFAVHMMRATARYQTPAKTPRADRPLPNIVTEGVRDGPPSRTTTIMA